MDNQIYKPCIDHNFSGFPVVNIKSSGNTSRRTQDAAEI